MTENEAIELLKGMQSPLEDYAELVGAPAFAYGHKYAYPDPQDYAIEEAIEALKEIQQYRAIGTVEECREAVSRLRKKENGAKCEECLFFKDRKTGRNGAVSGICGIKPKNGRRYGKSSACRFFEKDYENLEGMEDVTSEMQTCRK